MSVCYLFYIILSFKGDILCYFINQRLVQGLDENYVIRTKYRRDMVKKNPHFVELFEVFLFKLIKRNVQ